MCRGYGVVRDLCQCGIGSSWVEAEDLLEAIICHDEVGDSCSLLFVKEVVVCDGQEGHFVDRLEGGTSVKVHAAAHQFLKGRVAGWGGDGGGADGLGSKDAGRRIVVALVNQPVHMLVQLHSWVEVEICGSLGDL